MVVYVVDGGKEGDPGYTQIKTLAARCGRGRARFFPLPAA